MPFHPRSQSMSLHGKETKLDWSPEHPKQQFGAVPCTTKRLILGIEPFCFFFQIVVPLMLKAKIHPHQKFRTSHRFF